MDNLESITTEKTPTGFPEKIKKLQILPPQDIINNFLANLPIEERDQFNKGCAKVGNREMTISNILLESLLKEIDDIELVLADNNEVRLANNLLKKSLKTQLQNIFAILELNKRKQDNFFYVLGTMLKSLIKRN